MTVISRLTFVGSRVTSFCLGQRNIQHQCVRYFKARPKPPETPPKPTTTPPATKPTGASPSTTKYSNPRGEQHTLFKMLIYTAVSVPVCYVGCIAWYSVRRLQQETQKHPALDYHKKDLELRDYMNGLWNSFSYGRKMFVGIIAVNVGVYLLWKIPSLTPFMSRYFSCLPTRAHSVTSATLSAFSQQGTFHLLANMYVLWGFTGPLLHHFRPEELAFVYFGAATVGSFISAINKVAIGTMIPSVGASGAVLGFIAMVCYCSPDSRLSILLVDQIFPHSFSAETAILGIIAFDVIGILLRWRVLDHAAHLGGTVFGLLYAKYGRQQWRKWDIEVSKIIQQKKIDELKKK